MYSVTRNNIPCLNWRPPPVPKDRDMPKVKGEVHAEEDSGLKDNLGDWCQVPASVSDPPNLHATGSSYSCMSPSHSEYVVMMMKQILNTCPDDMRIDDDVIGIEEDYFIASEYENCMDDVMYSEEFNEDDVMLVLTSTNLIMD